jgi:hypothetical protein
MNKFALAIVFLLVASAMVLPATDDTVRTFHGEVADSQCSMNVHSLTRSHQEMLKMPPLARSTVSITWAANLSWLCTRKSIILTVHPRRPLPARR